MTAAELERLFESVKNWGRWGADDERGALNYITPARRESRPHGSCATARP